MKKTINRKSYNTEYDSELITSYTSVIDSWCRVKHYVYRKKSTGEYFEFWGGDSWNQGNIDLISEKKAKEIVGYVKAGRRYEFTAMMTSTRTLRKGYVMWGTKEDDPWDKKMAKLRAERRRQEKKEKEMKKEEKQAEVKEDKTWAVSHWGVMDVYQASTGHKFSKYDGRELSADKKGKVVYHQVCFRIVNNDYDKKNKDSWGGYKYNASIVMPSDDKKQAKEVIKGLMDETVKELGMLDAVMKDGVFLGVSEHNKEVMKRFYEKVNARNEEMCF